MLSTLRENYISGFRQACYALKLKSEKCSVNDPSSWKYKCFTGREHHTLDTEDGWREILSSSKGLAALSFLKANQSLSSIVTVLYTHVWSTPEILFNLLGQNPDAELPLPEGLNKEMRDFPGGPVVKNPPANAGDIGWYLVQEDYTCRGASKPTKAMCHNCRNPHALEPTLCKRSPQRATGE